MSNPDLELQHKVLTERLAAVYMAIARNVRDKDVSAILKEDARLFESQIEELELKFIGIDKDDALRQISTALQSSREGLHFESSVQTIPDSKL